MRITFVLPAWSGSPVGGFKVVYEYANRLSRLGHQATVVHPLLISCENLKLIDRFKIILRSRVCACLKIMGWLKLRWFDVFPEVELLLTPSLAEKYIPLADIIVATAWQTAEEVNKYGVDKGRKFYLIQHYEVWSGSKDKVDATWRMSLKKIVISRWLEEIALSMGQETIYIPNGIDVTRFPITQPIDKRDPETIGMLYHVYDWKGSKEGIEALQVVRDRFPALKAVFFSTYQPGSDVPNWVEFHKNPSPEELVEIYNSCSIFISPSWTEGWGLPASEAVACGCALVTTDSGGIREFAINEKTALVCPIKNTEALATTIIRLIEDDNLRLTLAMQGNEFIKRFTWEKAVKKFEATIIEG